MHLYKYVIRDDEVILYTYIGIGMQKYTYMRVCGFVCVFCLLVSVRTLAHVVYCFASSFVFWNCV